MDNNYVENQNNHSETDKSKKMPNYKAGVFLLTAVIALVCGYAGSWLEKEQMGKVVIQKVSKSSDEESGTTQSSVEVAKEISPTVVSIVTEKTEVSQCWFGDQVSSGAGSGVVIDENGYILTCAHVISGAEVIQVTTSDGEEYSAKVVGSYEDGDIAVLKIKGKGLETAVFGDSEQVQAGETVYAVGNPGGTLSETITDGIISATEQTIMISMENDGRLPGNGDFERKVSLDVMQTSAAVSPGNSGGGLFNAKGELIGIVIAGSSEESQEGPGFAIPINKAQEIATALINDGIYVDPDANQSDNDAVLEITISEMDQAMGQIINMEAGIYIQSVKEGGVSDGKLEAGDRIISVDETVVQTTEELSELLSEYKPGDTISVSVDRDRKLVSVEIVLAENMNLRV